MKITEQTQDVLPPEPDPRASNAARHGLGSEQVPTWERDAYAVHVRAVRASSGAQGYLQERLADRAALALWRLDRVARWEAVSLEAQQRRFHDGLSSPDALHDALSGLNPAPLFALDLRGSLKALSELTGEVQHVFLNDPACAERYAQDSDHEAAAWEALRAGADPAGCSKDTAATLGVDLLSALQQEWHLDAGRVAWALLGRKATRQEMQDVANWNWEVEPGELHGLVTEAARAAGTDWGQWLMQKQYEASSKAGKIRMIAARLPALLQQELAQATAPKTPDLEKITRYEAHLERVLYRALHELEVARREQQGKDTPGPVRMVLERDP